MNIKNMKRLMKHVYKKSMNGKYAPIMFIGVSGVGKSRVVEQIADECRNELGLKNFEAINYRLSQKEQGDLIGNPIEVEMVPCPYCIENGVNDFHHDVLHDKKKLMEHIYKMHDELKGKMPSYADVIDIIRNKYSHLIEIRTGYAVPDQLPTKGHGILHLDELNRATKGTRDAVFELVLERRMGKYCLPDGWIVVSSINPPSDEYIVHELDGAMVKRFCQIRFNPEHDEWMTYAAKNGLNGNVRQFVGEYPQFLGNDPVSLPYEPNPCPRTLEMLAHLIDGLPDDLVYEVAAGYIGTEAATAYMSMQTNKDRPVSAKKILDNYDGVATIVKKYANKKKNRADLLRISVDDLLVLLSKREDNLLDNEVDNLISFIKDIPKDLSVGFIKLMTKHDSEEIRRHFRTLSESDELRDFIQKEFKNIGCETL